MSIIKHHKVVAALPGTLEADSIYCVRAGTGFDIYVTNSSGTVVAYPLNKSALAVATLPDVVESPANSTADFDFLTLTLGQDLKAGATFEAQFFGTQSQAAATQTLTFYAKINGGTGVTIGSVGAGSSAQSFRAISGKALFTFPTVGASGSYLLAGDFTINSLAAFSSNSGSSRAASTLAGTTLTLGIRGATANALNLNRITGALIKQVT